MTEKKTAEEFEVEQRAIPDDRLAEMAQNALSKLCETGGRSITMTVPPRIDDTDMVIAEVIRRFKAYAAQQSKMPTDIKFPTREEIKAHFTTTHKPWKEEPYKKINYDRVTGAEWAFEWLRNQIG